MSSPVSDRQSALYRPITLPELKDLIHLGQVYLDAQHLHTRTHFALQTWFVRSCDWTNKALQFFKIGAGRPDW
jgi:hypothetical protein